MKFLEPTRKPKVIYTGNSVEFGKSCQELSWNQCTSECQRPQVEFFGGNKAALHPSKQMRQNPNQQFEVKIMITLLIGKQDGTGAKCSRETCRILRLRRPHLGRIPHSKIGIHGGGILQSLTKGSG